MVCDIALMNAWDCHVCVSMYIHVYVCTWSVDSREIVFTDKQELPNSRLLPYIGTLQNFSTYYFSILSIRFSFCLYYPSFVPDNSYCSYKTRDTTRF